MNESLLIGLLLGLVLRDAAAQVWTLVRASKIQITVQKDKAEELPQPTWKEITPAHAPESLPPPEPGEPEGTVRTTDAAPTPRPRRSARRRRIGPECANPAN